MPLLDKPEIPHKGWKLLTSRDLREEKLPYETCEWCGKTGLRYVHVLWHPTRPLLIKTGRCCSENISEEYKKIDENETGLRNRAKRKASFMDPSRWKRVPTQTYRRYKHLIVYLNYLPPGYWEVEIPLVGKSAQLKSETEAKEIAFNMIDTP